MSLLPTEVLLAVFDILDERSLVQATGVCRRWKLIGKDSLCRRGAPGQWLNVDSNHQFHHVIRRLHLRNEKDCEWRLTLLNLRDVSVALSVLASETYWKAIDILIYCGICQPLSLTIFDDRPDKSSGLSDVSSREDLRISLEAFYLLAYHGRLRHLVVESIFLPRPLESILNPCNGNRAFQNLYSLQTRTTADATWRMLSIMPTVRELSLDVIDSDPAGKVVGAAASLLPRLSVLKVNFWNRFNVKAERDLAILGRMSELRVLELRNKWLAADPALSLASPRRWRAFVSGMQRLESLWLPFTLEVTPTADRMRLIGTSCPNIRRLCLNVSVEVGELRRTGGGVLFPRLETLVIKSLKRERKQRYVSLTSCRQRSEIVPDDVCYYHHDRLLLLTSIL
jgi:hypothetical protein